MIGARPFAAKLPAVLAAAFILCAASVQAQQMYRWTDEKGAVHITDTPPPPSAKNVQKPKAAASPPSTTTQRHTTPSRAERPRSASRGHARSLSDTIGAEAAGHRMASCASSHARPPSAAGA